MNLTRVAVGLIAFVGMLLAADTSAEIRVAFFPYPTPQAGGERFFHVAISFQGKWLHSHPYWGVRLENSLEEIQKGPVILLENLHHPSLSPEAVLPLLGRPFDRQMDWSSDDRLYCSELVAKLLNIPPSEMSFESPLWPKDLAKRRGSLGISPDEIYEALEEGAFQLSDASTCAYSLTP